MSQEGFQLDPREIADEIGRNLREPGWHLAISLDSYARPDGMRIVHDHVDRAVVVFVGSREEAGLVMHAARQALGGDDVSS